MKTLEVESGKVRSVNFAQVPGRVRVVMNLYEAAAYETYADGNSLFVVVGDQSKNEKIST
ncbi:hypothetical protein [Aliamphritea spongicola]|nr:hypothetical protein [Aliamphritea spongicola]